MTSEGIVLDSNILNIAKASGLENFIVWILAFFVFLWIISIIWTAKDITARTYNTALQIVSIVLVTVLSPLVGLPLYHIIRPVGYKIDKLPWREACASNMIICYNCRTLNPKEYTCCISCGEQLKIECKQCNNTYPHIYQYCNECGAPNIDA